MCVNLNIYIAIQGVQHFFIFKISIDPKTIYSLAFLAETINGLFFS